MITVLAGGVGAAKFLQGLVEVVDPREVTIIGNTGDDIDLHGLHISPDLDIVTYTLAGMHRRRPRMGDSGGYLPYAGDARALWPSDLVQPRRL